MVDLTSSVFFDWIIDGVWKLDSQLENKMFSEDEKIKKTKKL